MEEKSHWQDGVSGNAYDFNNGTSSSYAEFQQGQKHRVFMNDVLCGTNNSGWFPEVDRNKQFQESPAFRSGSVYQTPVSSYGAHPRGSSITFGGLIKGAFKLSVGIMMLTGVVRGVQDNLDNNIHNPFTSAGIMWKDLTVPEDKKNVPEKSEPIDKTLSIAGTIIGGAYKSVASASAFVGNGGTSVVKGGIYVVKIGAAGVSHAYDFCCSDKSKDTTIKQVPGADTQPQEELPPPPAKTHKRATALLQHQM